MTMGTIIIIVIVAGLILVAVSIGFYCISIYNGLILLRNNITKAWANIDVILKQRHDELPKLIETVKSYMQYEKGLIEGIIRLRESGITAKTVSEKASISEATSRALTVLFARAEAYPNLKANETFQHLQQRISGLENELADRREFYNDSANLFNIRIESFPDMFMAKYMALQRQEMFKVSEEEKADVEIKIPFPK